MLDALWERLSGAVAAQTTLLYATRKRLLTFTSVLTFLVAAVWVGLTSATLIGERPLFAVLCGLTPFVFLPFPYLALKSRLDLDVLAHAYLIVLYAVVASVAASVGGAISTTSYFLVLAPLLGTLLLGVRTGLIWVGVVAATYAAFHLGRGALPISSHEMSGAYPSDWISAEQVSFWNSWMLTLLALAASLSVANFRAVVQKSSALLMQAALAKRDAEQARAAAEEISQSRSDFITSVSHEFRTPLNAILGYGELLKESAQERSDQADTADTQQVLDAAARLLVMVNEMLRLSAIDAGRLEVTNEECDVAALVADAVAALRTAASANGNRIEVDAAEFSGLWLIDGFKLDYCLRHLLSNAIKFTKDGLIRVRVRYDAAGRWLSIEIEDSGIGIDPANFDKIFAPFGLADASITRAHDGVGLGLTVTRRLAQLMGGDVTVESAPGRGARFTLRTPAEYCGDRLATGSVTLSR